MATSTSYHASTLGLISAGWLQISALETKFKAKGGDPAELKADAENWDTYLKTYIELQETQGRVDRLIATLPERRAELQRLQKLLPNLVTKAEQLADQLESSKQLIRSLGTLKVSVGTISRLRKEIERAESEVNDLETELSLTGSTKTVEDVQNELNNLTSEL